MCSQMAGITDEAFGRILVNVVKVAGEVSVCQTSWFAEFIRQFHQGTHITCCWNTDDNNNGNILSLSLVISYFCSNTAIIILHFLDDMWNNSSGKRRRNVEFTIVLTNLVKVESRMRCLRPNSLPAGSVQKLFIMNFQNLHIFCMICSMS